MPASSPANPASTGQPEGKKSAAEPALLAIDWGTSSLRAVLLDASGQVQREHRSAHGILSIPADGFAPFFEANFSDWMCRNGKKRSVICLLSGMVGSRQGWREAAYCPCPAGPHDLARHMCWIEPGRIGIVPGLSHRWPALIGADGLDTVPDVMRGEEVQVFGALRLLGLRDARLVLPGTHSKWVEVRNGCIVGFQTAMTGEVYALLRQHSILARTLPAAAAHATEPWEPAVFDRAVAWALCSPGLLTTAFSTRTLALLDGVPAEDLLSHLSGLVIGEELRAQSAQGQLGAGTRVVVVGSGTLTERYARALTQMAVQAEVLGESATWRGLLELAQHLSAPN